MVYLFVITVDEKTGIHQQEMTVYAVAISKMVTNLRTQLSSHSMMASRSHSMIHLMCAGLSWTIVIPFGHYFSVTVSVIFVVMIFHFLLYVSLQ